MVRVHTDTRSLENLNEKMVGDIPNSDKIEISSEFQRGDEETGVWDIKKQKGFIEALENKFPTGILTLVKCRDNATSYQMPLKVLDGGNRLRAIRDFMNNKIPNTQGILFDDLEAEPRAQFKTVQMPCQTITIERGDPHDTIAKMFCNLNTTSAPLSAGELFKAHGWKKNCWVIELSKQIIGGSWDSDFDFDFTIEEIPCATWLRNKWINAFNALEEGKRCQTMAMLIGYILSAVSSDFKLFDKRYDNLSGHLPAPDIIPTHEQIQQICYKFEKFLRLMKIIYNRDIFGKLTKGIPSKGKIGHIWYTICINTMDDELFEKIVSFYEEYHENYDLRNQYSLITASGDGWTPIAKMGKTIEFIKNWQ